MAAAKTAGNLMTNQAGSATIGPIDCSSAYVINVPVSISQTGTPSTPAQVQVQYSVPGQSKVYSPTDLLMTGPIATGSKDHTLIVPPGAGQFWIVYTPQIGSGNSSACWADYSLVTG